MLRKHFILQFGMKSTQVILCPVVTVGCPGRLAIRNQPASLLNLGSPCPVLHGDHIALAKSFNSLKMVFINT